MEEYIKFLQDFKSGKININDEEYYTKDNEWIDFISRANNWEDQVARAMIVSFSQYRLEMMFAYENGTYEHYLDTADKAMNTDNHQIWWPKGTIVRKWFSKDLLHIAAKIQQPDQTTSISDFTNYVVKVFKDHGWRNSRYTVKHFIKNLSQVDNNIDSNSYVEPGAGSRNGLSVIFGGNFDNKKKQELALNEVVEKVGDLMLYHKYINHESCVCAFWKYKNGKYDKYNKNE